MCGIFGVINPTNRMFAGINHLLDDFLVVGMVRGTDGTGMMKVNDNGASTWIKSACPGNKFKDKGGVWEFLRTVDSDAFVVGHHRSATLGTINDDNTHPFEHGHITLVHNGTVSRTTELTAGNDYSVDSAMVTHKMADLGVQGTVNEMYGAYSLVWYDAQKLTLNFIRNKERPMNFITTKEGLIIFCSELEMGVWLAHRRGFEIKGTAVTDLDTHYAFDIGDPKPHLAVVKPVRKPYVAPLHQDYSRAGHVDFPIRGRAGRKVVSLNERARFMSLFDQFTINQQVYFSLADFKEPKKNSKFTFVEGDHPKLDDVVVEGNFSGDFEKLGTTKNLLSGRVTTKAWSQKRGKVVLQVKDIKITDSPDPFFDKVKNDLEELQSPKSKPTPLHQSAKPGLSTDQCNDCGTRFSRVNGDDPYLVKRAGKGVVICAACFMETSHPDSIIQGARA